MISCNICGGHRFSDYRGRPAAKCNECGAFERTRMLAMHLCALDLPEGARVLHVAPEQSLVTLLKEKKSISEYTIADFAPEKYKFAECKKIDLCDLAGWPSNYFDLILHCHVLEHTICNIAYTLFHLHRMLKQTGRHVFVVPFTSGRFEESFFKLGAEEATARFGQWDHVRRFGKEDIKDHLGSIVQIPDSFDAASSYGADALRAAGIPERQWSGLHGSTILDISKDDYLLQ